MAAYSCSARSDIPALSFLQSGKACHADKGDVTPRFIGICAKRRHYSISHARIFCTTGTLAAGCMDLPVLSAEEAFANLKANSQGKPYRAMYSSVLNGITTDVACMFVPVDDHMVHRGHGVFDTSVVVNGFLYELDAHLDRLLRSASMAKITPPFCREKLREILLKTAAVSNIKDGFLKFWLSVGPGNFDLSSQGCTSAFYAVVLDTVKESQAPAKVITSSIPMKPPFFATMKNVNYLPNALSQLEAEEQGALAGIWVDDEGFVGEGPNVNVAFVNAGELIMPSFDKILMGCTARRVLTLAQESLDGLKPPIVNLKRVSVRSISVEEAKSSAEMMMLGSSLHLVPIVQWDEQQIGSGEPGPVTLALRTLLEDDVSHYHPSVHVRIPYDGYAKDD